MTEPKIKLVRSITLILGAQKFLIELRKHEAYKYSLSLNGLVVAADISDRWDANYGYDALVQAIALGSEI